MHYERVFQWVSIMQYGSLQMHESLQGLDQDIAHFLNESMRYIFLALRRYLPLPSLRSRYFGRKGVVEGMSPTLREFSTRHCLICQFIVLECLSVTPGFGTTAKETPALMVLCVRSDEPGHAGKMRSCLTTFTNRQYQSHFL